MRAAAVREQVAQDQDFAAGVAESSTDTVVSPANDSPIALAANSPTTTAFSTGIQVSQCSLRHSTRASRKFHDAENGIQACSVACQQTDVIKAMVHNTANSSSTNY